MSDESKKITHESGAASSHKTPNYFLIPGKAGLEATAQRFEYGNTKYENGNTVYAEANWLKAYNAKDVAFFRDRAGHVIEHLYEEMRGEDDSAPGGNLGAIGWFQAVMAFIKENDPYFYGAIQGKYKYEQMRTVSLASLGTDFSNTDPTKWVLQQQQAATFGKLPTSNH